MDDDECERDNRKKNLSNYMKCKKRFFLSVKNGVQGQGRAMQKIKKHIQRRDFNETTTKTIRSFLHHPQKENTPPRKESVIMYIID